MGATEHEPIDVLVTRSGRWWAIRFPSMPDVFSQCRRLEQVDEFAREALALALERDPGDVGPLRVNVVPPDDVAQLIAESNRLATEARLAAESAARARRAAASALAARGYPTRDIGALLGLSHQRVSQLLAEAV
jgi:hypothetical protein